MWHKSTVLSNGNFTIQVKTLFCQINAGFDSEANVVAANDRKDIMASNSARLSKGVRGQVKRRKVR